MNEEKEHILSLSYGKDSLACLGAIEKLGWPLDRIVHAEIWATNTIPADLPPMVEFKKKEDTIIKARWGIEVEHFEAKKAEGVSADRVSFEDCFYRKMASGKHIGTIKGFPMQKGNWCIKLKLNAIKQSEITANTIQYVGIAQDEPERLDRLGGTKKYHHWRRWTGQKRIAAIGAKKTAYFLLSTQRPREGDAGSVITRALDSSASSGRTTRNTGP